MSDQRTEIAASLLAAMLNGIAGAKITWGQEDAYRSGIAALPSLAVRLTDDLLNLLSDPEKKDE